LCKEEIEPRSFTPLSQNQKTDGLRSINHFPPREVAAREKMPSTKKLAEVIRHS
jgi:hypothetical protein